MKTLFYGYGYRKTKLWNCRRCNNFNARGMDLSVDELRRKHEMSCHIAPVEWISEEAEVMEPLFVKKSWVPQWLWNLVSESRLSYFDHEKPYIDPGAEAQVASAKVPADAGAGAWTSYSVNFNNSANYPSHLKYLELSGAEWFVQALHDALCPIADVGRDFRTYRERYPNGLERKFGS